MRAFVLQHLLRQLFVLLDHALHAAVDGALHQRAHLEQLGFELLQFLFKMTHSFLILRPNTSTSTETAGDVIFGFFLPGFLKIFLVSSNLDQLAQQEEAGVVGHARGLLHVVRDDHDGA